AKNIDEKLAEAQQELFRIQKWQKEALDIVKELKGKKEADQKALDRLVEAEQLQRQIKERIGAQPEEGLRNEMQKLQQLLRDNKMKESEAQEQVDMIKGTLDQLAQRELQQIEPTLAETRKKLAGEESKDAKE